MTRTIRPMHMHSRNHRVRHLSLFECSYCKNKQVFLHTVVSFECPKNNSYFWEIQYFLGHSMVVSFECPIK